MDEGPKNQRTELEKELEAGAKSGSNLRGGNCGCQPGSAEGIAVQPRPTRSGEAMPGLCGPFDGEPCTSSIRTRGHLRSLGSTAGCGTPHVRWCGRVAGSNPRHSTRSRGPLHIPMTRTGQPPWGWPSARPIIRTVEEERAGHGVPSTYLSGVLASRETRGPGPLKIEPAQLTGDVDHLADEVESGHALRFHGLRR